MSNLVEEKLGHLRTPFIIAEDGSSQTQLTNTGRVGFHIEKLFGIDPNKDRRPDLGIWEIKTVSAGKKVTIGTMPDNEVRRICEQKTHVFADSDPYKKMKNTLFVIYERLAKYPEPKYIMHGWGACKLENLSDEIKNELQQDYKFISNVIKTESTNQSDLTARLMKHGSVSGEYLSLGYKGAGAYGYNYPAWSFTTRFIKKINHA